MTTDFTRDRIPALPSFRPGSFQGISLIGAVLLVQFFFLLLALNKSTLFGGDWSSYATFFAFYPFLLTGGLVIYGWSPAGMPEDQPGSTAKFLRWFGVFFLVTVAALIAVFTFVFSAPSGTTTGSAKIAALVYILAFVAPTEEFVFRVVLPRKIGWILGSVILFSLFHSGVDFAGGTGVSVYNDLAQQAFLGLILFGIYDYKVALKGPDGRPLYEVGPNGKLRRSRQPSRLFGFGGAVGFHAAYDLVVLGVVTTFQLRLLGFLP